MYPDSSATMSFELRFILFSDFREKSMKTCLCRCRLECFSASPFHTFSLFLRKKYENLPLSLQIGVLFCFPVSYFFSVFEKKV